MGTKDELAGMRRRHHERMQQAARLLERFAADPANADVTRQQIQDLVRAQRQDAVTDSLQGMFRDAATDAIASLELLVDAELARQQRLHQGVTQRQKAMNVMDQIWRAASADYDSALAVIDERHGNQS